MKKMHGKLGVAVVAASLIVFLASGTSFAKKPEAEVFVIGDSLSDSGNLYELTGFFPPSPPYAQRYSNGPVWTEYFSKSMRIPVDSRAYGGALSGVLNTEDYEGKNYGVVSNYNNVKYDFFGIPLPGVSEEIDGLIEDYNGRLNSNALYVVWAGANDFFLALEYYPANLGDILFGKTIPNIAGSVCKLSAAGARHFAVGNMPDILSTPEGRALPEPLKGPLTFIIESFNTALEYALTDLPTGCETETMVVLDTYQIMQEVASDPGLYDLDNATNACLTSTAISFNPDEYLFWDSVHPTTAGHAIFAEEFQAEFKAAYCGTGTIQPGVRGRPDPKLPVAWRNACYGTK